MDFNMDKLREECGVFGIYSPNDPSISRMLTYGLVALQHRGQESAGIAVKENGRINFHKDMGLVRDIFNDEILDKLVGDAGIGHVRYSTTGESYIANAQPIVVNFKGGSLALAHNGNLVNAGAIRNDFEDRGSIFTTTIDSEVIAHLIARYHYLGVEESVIKAACTIKGAFALVLVMEDKLIGVRDPYALRPLCLGELPNGGYVLASETCALDVVGAKYVRDIEKGEMVVINKNGVKSFHYDRSKKKKVCSFEYVYFARPDSTMDGVGIYESRKNAGKILAQEHPVEADLVFAVPDSGIDAAIGYAEESGIEYGVGLIKNKYLGRTFIQPDQTLRELAVKLKLNVLKQNVDGKRVVMIDDSIVRGTTITRIVNMVREAGAKEVHVRISSPPVNHSCYFGIDTPSRKQLVASEHSVEEIREMIGADSLGYISEEGLVKSINMDDDGLCRACFSGDYPMEVPKIGSKFVFDKY